MHSFKPPDTGLAVRELQGTPPPPTPHIDDQFQYCKEFLPPGTMCLAARTNVPMSLCDVAGPGQIYRGQLLACLCLTCFALSATEPTGLCCQVWNSMDSQGQLGSIVYEHLHTLLLFLLSTRYKPIGELA